MWLERRALPLVVLLVHAALAVDEEEEADGQFCSADDGTGCEGGEGGVGSERSCDRVREGEQGVNGALIQHSSRVTGNVGYCSIYQSFTCVLTGICM